MHDDLILNFFFVCGALFFLFAVCDGRKHAKFITVMEDSVMVGAV